MHGRKQKDRALQAQEPEDKKQEKVARFRKLRGLLETSLECRRTNEHSMETLQLAAQLLVINPSLNTLWSLRREALMEMASKEVGDLDLRKRLVQEELGLSGQALQKGNVKSHEAWSHRSWIVHTLGMEGKLVDLKEELALCTKLLIADERNFHCYQYRSELAKLANHTAEDDLKFAKELIERNFSNYSAWHLKIKALEKLEPLPLETIKEELDLVNNALFTEPDDQSGWMVYRWLIDRIPAPNSENSILTDQIQLCLELNELEQNQSKWAMLALIKLYTQQNIQANLENIRNLITTLKQVDPSHKGYYDFLERKYIGLPRNSP